MFSKNSKNFWFFNFENTEKPVLTLVSQKGKSILMNIKETDKFSLQIAQYANAVNNSHVLSVG